MSEKVGRSEEEDGRSEKSGAVDLHLGQLHTSSVSFSFDIYPAPLPPLPPALIQDVP